MTTSRGVALALSEACAKASSAGWDGYGGAPVAPGARAQAERFLRALPLDCPMPEVGVDPSGDVLLEWDRGARRVVTVTIDADGVVAYAGLFGEDRVHGRERFVDAIPPGVAAAVARLFAEAPTP